VGASAVPRVLLPRWLV